MNNLHKIFQAIKCFVAGVIPAEGEWSEACVVSVKALLLEQYCSVTVMDVLEEGVLTCAVDVVIESSGKIVVCLSCYLVPMCFSERQQTMDMRPSHLS